MVRSMHAPEKVQTGVFGAMMQVELVNDGPVTIILDSNDRKGKGGRPAKPASEGSKASKPKPKSGLAQPACSGAGAGAGASAASSDSGAAAHGDKAEA